MHKSSAVERASVTATVSGTDSVIFGKRSEQLEEEDEADSFTPELQVEKEEDRTQKVHNTLKTFAEQEEP